MGRRTQNEPDMASVRRQQKRLALPPEKREEIERALKQRIRGLLVSVMRAGADLYSPTEMIAFIEGEVADLRAAAQGREARVTKPLTEIRVFDPDLKVGNLQVTDAKGKPVPIGEWVEDKHGNWSLIIKSKGFVMP